MKVRWGSKPDGVCLVVGACNRGHHPEDNTTGDVICTTEDLRLSSGGGASGDGALEVSPAAAAAEAAVRDCQLFWEVRQPMRTPAAASRILMFLHCCVKGE